MIRYERGADGWVATADVSVGVEDVPVAVVLGALDRAPDPAGLHGTPVVVVASGSLAVARAGILRAGKTPAVLVLPGDAPGGGGHMLLAVQEGVEVILVEDGGADALTAARALAGRPILPTGRPEDVPATLEVDVTLAVATGGGGASLRATLATATPLHHVVEADPRPAFAELGWDAAAAPAADVAAGAAGVLAGRWAAGNRRWRQ